MVGLKKKSAHIVKYYADFKKNEAGIYGEPRENSTMHGEMLKATRNNPRKPVYDNVHRPLFAHAKRMSGATHAER